MVGGVPLAVVDPLMLRQAKALTGRCGRCRAIIHSGLDGAVAGIMVTIEHYPVGVEGEALAVVDGLASYLLDPDGRIYARTRWDYGQANRWPIHVEHRCSNQERI